MNIYQTIQQETALFRNKTAVTEGEYKLTYAQLFSFADMIGAALKKEGIGQYDRVALLLRDSIEYIAASLAVLSVSAVVVPIAAEHTEAEIHEILESIDVNYIIFENGAYNNEGAHKLELTDFSQKEIYLLKRGTDKRLEDEYYTINPAFIRFSSGTTGKSKGILLSHETIIERTSAADKGLNITQNDTVLWVLSMSFHFVVTILLFLRRAATIVLCSSPFPESLIDGIKKHEGTFIYASPFHYNLLTHLDSLPPDSFQDIRLAVSTAMKLPENIAHEFHLKFGIELSEAYGIIEIGLPFINLSSDRSRRSSVGKVLPDYEIMITDKDKDGVGQIYIKGKGMLDTYFSPWQNRDNVLKDGWFNTGDMGKMDEEGYLTIVGRDKDVINFAGMKVFPLEVESVLNQFPEVRESCVYGEDHAGYGQLPAAKVVLKQDTNEEAVIADLRRFCYKRLAQYKVPKSFQIVSHLTKTKSDKLKR